MGSEARETLTLGPGAAPGAAAAKGPQALAWKPGDVIGGLYEVQSLLGEGGFGTVHKVYHRGWRMELAVKAPRPDRVSSRLAMEAFVQEANTWVGLGLHPHIVACYFVRLIGVPRVFIDVRQRFRRDVLDFWLRGKGRKKAGGKATPAKRPANPR